MSYTELLLSNGRSAEDGFRIAKMLINTNKLKFIENVTKITYGYLNSPRNFVGIMECEIDKQILRLQSLSRLKTDTGRLIINLAYRNQNFISFHSDVCRFFESNPLYSKFFVYGYKSSYNQIYNDGYNLYFRSNIDGFDEIALLNDLNIFFARINRRILSLKIINSEYLNYIFIDKIVLEKCENILLFINKKLISLTEKDINFESNERFVFVLLLSNIIINFFHFSKEEIIEFSSWLVMKWRVKDFDKSLRYEDILFRLQKINFHFEKSINSQVRLFSTLRDHKFIKQYISEKDIKKLQYLIEDFFNAITSTSVKFDELYYMSININNISGEKRNIYWYLSKILYSILDMYEISSSDRSYFAFILRYF